MRCLIVLLALLFTTEAAMANKPQGTLVVKADVDGGIVIVDGEVRARLVKGIATVQLPAGTYKVALDVAGYASWEYPGKVVIRAGETTTITAELKPRRRALDPLRAPYLP